MYCTRLTIFCLVGAGCIYATPVARSSDSFVGVGPPVDWLFTTYHNGGSITVKDGEVEFELDQVSKEVIAFSDRPQRVVKTINSSQFETAFNDPELFGDDPPNAATQIKITCDDNTVEFVNLVFEMLAVKDSDDDTVIYEIEVLESLNVDGEPSRCIDFSVDGKHNLEDHSSGVFIDDVTIYPSAPCGSQGCYDHFLTPDELRMLES